MLYFKHIIISYILLNQLRRCIYKSRSVYLNLVLYNCNIIRASTHMYVGIMKSIEYYYGIN